jgi:Mrp family chromosome partitioning ATPase
VVNGRSVPAALWRRRWTALLAVALVAAATTAWLILAPREYTATATVTATPQQSAAAVHGTVEELQATIAAVANSAPVIRDLATRVDYRGNPATLQGQVSAARVPGTALIRVQVESRSPRFAARAADALVGLLADHDPTGGQFRIAVASLAPVPADFSSPKVAGTIAWAVLGAVVLAVAAALLRERTAGRVDDRRQLARLARTPVLAVIARPSDPGEKTADLQAGPSAADFRALRIGLEFATSDRPTSIAVLAPAVRDDAAAWTAINLAGALAVVEHRVLVIDADFGAPAAHPAFKSRGPGLAEVLRGQVELRDAVRPTPVSGVSVLPAGKLDGADGSALLELQFHRAMAQIDKEVDVILVHCAPLAERDDALVMAAGNALLLTVAAGRVRPGAVRDLGSRVHRNRVRLVGAVLLGRKPR